MTRIAYFVILMASFTVFAWQVPHALEYGVDTANRHYARSHGCQLNPFSGPMVMTGIEETPPTLYTYQCPDGSIIITHRPM